MRKIYYSLIFLQEAPPLLPKYPPPAWILNHIQNPGMDEKGEITAFEEVILRLS